jgi:hypothetical protein
MPHVYVVAKARPFTVAAPGLQGPPPRGETATATVTLGSRPRHGTLTMHADGGFAYTPRAGFTGTDTFTYTVKRGEATSEPATVTVLVR